MYCPRCNTFVPDGGRFCPECGLQTEAPAVEAGAADGPFSAPAKAPESLAAPAGGKPFAPLIGFIACGAVILALFALLGLSSLALSSAQRQLKDNLNVISGLEDEVAGYTLEVSSFETDTKSKDDEIFLLTGEITALNLHVSELEEDIKNYELQAGLYEGELASLYSDAESSGEVYREYEFYHDNACVQDESDGVYYHRYDCPDVPLDSFFVYNTNYAEYIGLLPCPTCFGE